jgi:glucose-6-phosphate isomerase
MSKEISPSYIFENDRVSFESYIDDFTPELYKEFDLKANDIGLHSKIDDLFGGKKVNYTENLAAWHPKYRDQYNPSSFDTPSNKNQQVELSNLKDLCCNAKNIVTIGIGGSFEGPKMLVESMDLSQDDAKFIFITGSDSNEFKIKTKQLNPKDTIFLVSSKSFTTMETISMLKEALSWSGELNKFIAITANKEEAEKYKINNIIEFDKEIGGRYSIWSEISSLIHCLKKNEYDDFMAGGKQADIDLKKNTSYIKFVKALAYSDIWFHNSKNKNSRVILSYDWNLRSFTNYIQQLEMESLGKQPSIRSEFKKTGQIIFGGYGPTAQHSYFQLLHQGTQDICADIIASKKDKKSLAYAQAITQSRLMTLGDEVFNDHEKINADIPINLFLINNTSSYELGYLLATWEHRTYITAVMLGINPFDQFGVIASKIYTKKYLSDKD